MQFPNIRMAGKLFPAIFFLLYSLPGKSATVQQVLHLNAGMFMAVDSSTFFGLAFNATSVYRQNSEVIQIHPGDSLSLKIFNNDTSIHSFFVPGYMGSAWSILPGDSASGVLHFPATGLFLYWDDVNFPDNRYLGACGMIYVGNTSAARTYFWNIREQWSGFNTSLASGGSVNWSNYKPDFFTVNGNGRPGILLDTTAMVRGNVGDTITICMGNTGQGMHSIHFHGYHCRITYASEDPAFAGREKDTFPLTSAQTMVLQLVPDKPGQYPVHDHNLVAVSGGGIYKNGIFLYLDIQ